MLYQQNDTGMATECLRSARALVHLFARVEPDPDPLAPIVRQIAAAEPFDPRGAQWHGNSAGKYLPSPVRDRDRVHAMLRSLAQGIAYHPSGPVIHKAMASLGAKLQYHAPNLGAGAADVGQSLLDLRNLFPTPGSPQRVMT